jgi:hypothetical protein
MTGFNTIKQLLTKGDTASAMEMLLLKTQDSNKLHKQAIVLAARYEKWNEAKRMGILDGETELNKINVSILELAEQSDRISKTSLSNTLTKKASYSWTIGLVLLAILIVIGWLLKDVLFLQNDNPHAPVTQNETTESTNLGVNNFKNKVFKPELNTWAVNIQPYGATCKMTILAIDSEVKDLNTTYLNFKISVQHVYDGWYPAQLTSDLFLLKKDDLAEKTITDLSVVSIGQHETKQLHLQFSIPNTLQHLVFAVKDSEGQLIEIPISIQSK